MLDVLVKLLNWFFNRFERRFGLYMGRRSPPDAARECPACAGRGVLPDSGDVCPACNGAGRVRA